MYSYNRVIYMKGSKTTRPKLYTKAISSGSQLGSLYGLPKVHTHYCPLRPIVNAKFTHNANLSKLLVPMLSQLAVNEHTVLKNQLTVQLILCVTLILPHIMPMFL